MAFRFSLQTLLCLRRNYERRERLRLESIVNQATQVRRRIESLKQESHAAQHRLLREMEEGMAGSELYLQAVGEATQVQRRAALRKQLAELEQELRRQQAVFREAQQQRQVLDNLRDQQLSVYRQIQKRREQQQSDDLFSASRSARPRV